MKDRRKERPIAAPGRLRTIAHALGIAVTVLALVVVGWRVAASAGQIDAFFRAPRFIAMLAVATALYVLPDAAIGAGWVVLVNAGTRPPFAMRRGLDIHARSQILKYIPSNVVHFVGRHGLARKAGASHAALGFAMLAETLLLIAAAALMAIVFALPVVARHVWPRLVDARSWLAVAASIGLIGATVLAIYGARRLSSLRATAAPTALALATASAIYLGCFWFNGTLVFALLSSMGVAGAPYTGVIGVVAAAWLCGYVVPGAAAGFGVREIVLIAGLTSLGLEAQALPAALAYRIVTLGGDASLALLAALFPVRS